MTAESIRALCLQGTETYLAYLESTGKGLERVAVTNIESVGAASERTFKLSIGQRILGADGVQLEVRPRIDPFGPKDFKIVDYDSDTRTLVLKVQNADLQLDKVEPERVNLVSDLRFLVRNVQRWFEQNGTQLLLPATTAGAGFLEKSGLCDNPQRAAISGLLTHPLTYVWGPPGTGKTKVLLTQAVLKLALADKRVGIFAPTNNALEQAMTAFLEEADSTSSVDREKVIRVGTPSRDFAARFPEVCEVQGLERKKAELANQIRIYDRVLNCRRGPLVLDSVAALQPQFAELTQRLGRWRTLHEEFGGLTSNPVSKFLHKLSGHLGKLEEERERLKREINGLIEMIRRTHTESPRLNRMIENLSLVNAASTSSEVERLEQETRQYLIEGQSLAEEYAHEPTQQILLRKSAYEMRLEKLRTLTLEERVKSSLVIGMTLDGFIGKFWQELISFDHVFLDEAGYAPVVKALTLFRAGIPITLIGDHKQLGPVCEMGQAALTRTENTDVFLWKRSAIYFPVLFQSETREAAMQTLANSSEPDLSGFHLATLHRTYRFGQNLADILSDAVYRGIRMISANPHNLEVICLSAPMNQEPTQPRENEAEAEAIARFLQDNPDLLASEDEGRLAIITPYKRQVALLGQRLPEARRQGRILTVNKAQGREWQTVIFSVVDGAFNRPWFGNTRSQASGGLFVVNTAVSRARRRLVLVCDKEFWLRQEDADEQLVSLLARTF